MKHLIVPLDPRLLAIKPAHTKVRFASRRSLEKRHGAGYVGAHFSGKKWHTIVITPTTIKEDVAHEFGHAALGHRSTTVRTADQQAKRELQVSQWVKEHWGKLDTKKEVSLLGFQIMERFGISKDEVLPIVRRQMMLLNMKPLTPAESRWIDRDLAKTEAWMRENGWEPRHTKGGTR